MQTNPALKAAAVMTLSLCLFPASAWACAPVGEGLLILAGLLCAGLITAVVTCGMVSSLCMTRYSVGERIGLTIIGIPFALCLLLLLTPPGDTPGTTSGFLDFAILAFTPPLFGMLWGRFTQLCSRALVTAVQKALAP